MSCRKYRSRLSAYVNGDISRESCSHLVVHLKSCSRCSTLTRAHEAQRIALASVRDNEPSPGDARRLVERVMHRVTTASREPALDWLDYLIGVARPASALAVAVAVVLLFIMMSTMNEPPNTDPLAQLEMWILSVDPRGVASPSGT
ncbi:MAG: zf-HC2 domain-containing protein [Proteobacteria bacterium]|nr:zf-HC2 domain-containing protein [Pseudomonadota bacterium]